MATIRLSKVSDAPNIIPLVNSVYETCEGHLWKPGHNRISSDVFDQYHQNRELVVAEVNDEIVGCVRMGRMEGYREVAMLVVRPDIRGQRIGTQMMEWIERSARSDGCGWLEIELLYPKNQPDRWKSSVRGWYERLGFRWDRDEDFGKYFPGFKDLLAMECNFIVMKKQLE